MSNQSYFLVDGEVSSREATSEELAAARKAAKEKLKATDGAGWAMRSCWNCNHAHSRFLEDTKDNFLFSCVMGCGRWYYNGVDITE